eukprot:TRINITY_DN17656_c0_g1_i3.p1 TRINITY_DN17656_c0_g1~~TRINITY_DN17656_c0_g1_i3.p1  ORF type:complete len:573 (+),score=98.95 TRINITY_DN17656_c0_g1_i3:602-2320(+)
MSPSKAVVMREEMGDWYFSDGVDPPEITSCGEQRDSCDFDRMVVRRSPRRLQQGLLQKPLAGHARQRAQSSDARRAQSSDAEPRWSGLNGGGGSGYRRPLSAGKLNPYYNAAAQLLLQQGPLRKPRPPTGDASEGAPLLQPQGSLPESSNACVAQQATSPQAPPVQELDGLLPQEEPSAANVDDAFPADATAGFQSAQAIQAWLAEANKRLAGVLPADPKVPAAPAAEPQPRAEQQAAGALQATPPWVYPLAADVALEFSDSGFAGNMLAPEVTEQESNVEQRSDRQIVTDADDGLLQDSFARFPSVFASIDETGPRCGSHIHAESDAEEELARSSGSASGVCALGGWAAAETAARASDEGGGSRGSNSSTISQSCSSSRLEGSGEGSRGIANFSESRSGTHNSLRSGGVNNSNSSSNDSRSESFSGADSRTPTGSTRSGEAVGSYDSRRSGDRASCIGRHSIAGDGTCHFDGNRSDMDGGAEFHDPALLVGGPHVSPFARGVEAMADAVSVAKVATMETEEAQGSGGNRTSGNVSANMGNSYVDDFEDEAYEEDFAGEDEEELTDHSGSTG